MEPKETNETMEESKTNSQLTDEFLAQFTKTKKEITQNIEDLKEGDDNMNDKLNALSARIKTLADTLHKSFWFLPAYTKKVRQNDLAALEELLRNREEEVFPRPKFTFKTKYVFKTSDDTPDATNLEDEPKKTEVAVAPKEYNFPKDDANFLTIQATSEEGNHKTITYEEDRLNRVDVMVRNLEGKEIVLNGSPCTLRIMNLKNCKLLCGPVQTSVFIDDCTDCTFHLCCQQLRTHDSSKLDIYLRVSSRGIIENCTEIRFAPFRWNHPKSSDFHKIANIDENLENFDAIDDFNWLAFRTQSPNWSLLPEAERTYFQ